MSKKQGKMNICGTSLKEAWECFTISQNSKCLSDATLSNCHHHLWGIGKHLDIEMPLLMLFIHPVISSVLWDGILY